MTHNYTQELRKFVRTCFNWTTIFEPLHLECWVTNRFQSGFKVCKTTLTDVVLIPDGRLELRWSRALRHLLYIFIVLLLLIGFQLLNLLDVTLLLRKSQVPSHTGSCCNNTVKTTLIRSYKGKSKIVPLCDLNTRQAKCRYNYTHTSPSSLSSRPEAYAPDAPQPIGLLCDPCPPVILDIPTSAARCLHVHMTQEILAAKGGTVGKNVGW